MNANTHPIDLFIVLLLEMIEGLCWIINELAGFHTTTTTTTSPSQTFSDNTQSVITSTQPTITSNQDYIEYVMQLTIRQLQQLTGVTNSRYRKAELQQIAITL